MNNEFWMPAPISGPVDVAPFAYDRLTAREQAVLRRLMRRGTTLAYRRRGGGARQRAALRQRRLVLSRLGIHDLRSLVHIVMELGL